MKMEFENLVVQTSDGQPLLDIKHACFEPGITALVGANGAGKSTLLRSIFDLHTAYSGRITLGGLDNRRDRRKFLSRSCFQFQNFTAYPELRGLEFLEHMSRLRGRSMSDAKDTAQLWLEAVKLGDHAKRKIGTYSQGMVQRLGFAYAMQTGSELCVLDEPFAGVDAEGRAALGALLRQQAQERIIIICTHHQDEVMALGARLATLSDRTLALSAQP